MEWNIAEIPAVIGRYLLMIQVTDVLDIAIMAFVMYKVFILVQSTKAAVSSRDCWSFSAALVLSYLLHLNGINYILNKMVEWGVLALIILFQPEIRRVLEQMGSRRIIAFFTNSEASGTTLEQTIGQTVLACTEMSQSRTGALIVFEREILLDDMVRSGTVLDAAASSELLKNIFFVKAPMHDGAVIIPRRPGAGCGLYAAPEQECQFVPGSGHAPPGRYRHE